MKIFFPSTLAALLCLAPAFAQQPIQVEAHLIYEEGASERVWIVASTKTHVRYKENEQSASTRDAVISGFQSIYIIEPPALTEAMELYQAGSYAEAREKFAAIRRTYQTIEELPDNPSTLAGLYELECLRHLGQLDALVKGLEGFDSSALTRENDRRQIELYNMWTAAEAKSWDRLKRICDERIGQRMPGYQRAQVGYCLGLALEATGQSFPAIQAYNIAMTADGGASTALARTAAVNALRLYAKDPELQTALKLWGTEHEDPNSRGHRRLVEAGALAAVHDLTFGAGHPLPDDVKDLLKYRPVPAGAE